MRWGRAIPKDKLRCVHETIKKLIPGMKASTISSGDITLSFKKAKKFSDFYKLDRLVDVTTEESLGLKRRKIGNLKIQTTFSLRYLISQNFDTKEEEVENFNDRLSLAVVLPKPELMCDLAHVDAEADHRHRAAIKLQKVYKSYRTRRYLADWAVVCEERWWNASNSTAFGRFFTIWERARTKAAKVGKGLLSKDGERAQRLALRHWLETIDPRHRYGHNLHFYYNVWFRSQSSQPFFFWLDVGDGKKVDLEMCPRKKLQCQRIQYLGPKEREAYEVIVKGGKLVYKQSKKLVHTTEGSKWIFVLSPSRILYVGKKEKGHFQHSSFLAGAATIASGRMVAHNGVLHVIWPYSGHYRPTAKNFMEFICYLEEHNVDMTHVKKHPVDDDVLPPTPINEELQFKFIEGNVSTMVCSIANNGQENVAHFGNNTEMKKPISSKWSTGAGPRICCVMEYPPKLQLQALQQLNLSPRVNHGTLIRKTPIPSRRPSPVVYMSPRLAHLGLSTP